MKKMNTVYPKTHMDFDAEFLFYMVDAVFTKAELKPILKQPSLRLLNKSKLALVKGNLTKI